MKKCPKCGKEDNAEYCSKCGTKLVRIDTLSPNGGGGESQQSYFGIK